MILFLQEKKLKVDNENELVNEKVIGDDEIVIVKVVPSLVFGKNHARVRCSLGKGHHVDNSNCPCPVHNCSSGSLASSFNAYSADLKHVILCTGNDLKKRSQKQKFLIGN